MADEFPIILDDAQRMCIAEVFDEQRVQIQDYEAALIWKDTFDRIIGDWDWRTRKVVQDPNRRQTTILRQNNAHVLVLQLLVAMREGTYTGGEVRTMIEVIEMVRQHAPDLIRLDGAGAGS